MKILTTKDYSIFKKISYNRELNEAHVVKLMQSMKVNMMPFVFPVNKDMELIDGQHRLEAIKRLDADIEVNYTILEKYDYSDIVQINQTMKKWTNQDYLNLWLSRDVNIDKTPYLTYQHIAGNYPFGHCMIISMIGIDNGGSRHRGFKLGTFRALDLLTSVASADSYLRVSQRLTFPIDRNLIIAISWASNNPDFDLDSFVHKLELYPDEFTKQISAVKYLEKIANCYNYRKKGSRIYLTSGHKNRYRH